MGITIQYRGYIKEKAYIDNCLELISNYAAENQWECGIFCEDQVNAVHSYEDEEGEIHSWNYTGL